MKNHLEFFKRTLKNNKLSHLYLLNGQSRTQLLEVAKEIVYLILTDTKLNDELRYDRIKREQDPNVFFINSNFEQIKKEDILALQDEFSKTADVKGQRFYIISSIDTITTSAANSMLKFLEEPIAKNSIGLLLTTNKDQVIPTIISRSQEITIPAVSKTEFISSLPKEYSDFEKELSFVITRSADKAKVLLNDDTFRFISKTLQEMFKNFTNQNMSFHIYYYQQLLTIITNTQDLKLFTETFFVFFTDLLKEIANEMVFASSYQEIKDIKKFYDRDKIKNFIKIAETFNKRANYSVALNIQLFNFLAKLDGERNG